MQVYEPFAWNQLEADSIIGVDEVGRGCLAGPVYAAAAILDPQKDISYLTDSKKISEKRRSEYAERILSDHHVGIGFATIEEIDEINILRASLLAMKRAVLNLKVDLNKAHLLVDGKFEVPMDQEVVQTTLVKGDFRAAPISAASIVAKVTRDNLLAEMAQKFPQYGFEKHKGYSTKAHKEAIAQYGPCVVHRKTFAGVKEHLI